MTSSCPQCGKRYLESSRNCNRCNRDVVTAAPVPKVTQDENGTQKSWSLFSGPLNVMLFINRAFIGCGIWIALGALVLSGVFPTHLGRTLLYLAWNTSSYVLPVWALAGFFKSYDDPKVGSELSPDRKCPHCGKVTPKVYDECIWCHIV